MRLDIGVRTDSVPARQPMRHLVLATRNRHKVAEIQAVLGSGLACESLLDHPTAPAVAEDADTFAGNAKKKALGLADWLRLSLSHETAGTWLVLADDSGLEVDALQGAPGVHSARFASFESGRSGNSPDAENNARLLALLSAVPWEQRTARFRCVLALAALDPPTVWLFEGSCEGRILSASRGTSGFGYDPLFQPEGYRETFAELGEGVKNTISHRARALAGLRQHLLL